MTSYRLPDFSFAWHHFLRRPWKLRWSLRTIPAHYGPEFADYYVMLGQSLHWPAERIEQYQWQQVKSLIAHALRTVPFYQRWSAEHQATAEDFRSWGDFRKLPIINRTHLDESLPDFTSSEYARHRGAPAQTSGSTGRLLKFYRSWNTEAMRRAVQWRHFNQIGYEFKQRRVSLNVPFVGEEADLLYRYDPIENLVAFNGRFLHEESVEAIGAVIRRFQPRMFYAHPSALAALATAMRKANLLPLNIPLVYVYSEVISAAQLELLRRWIGPNVYDHYGNRENSVSASQLACGRYHINSEFVYNELAPSSEQFAGRPLGRVLGTNLVNYAMPLLRYDCRDLAIEIRPCDRCRNAHSTIEFVGGRDKNFLISRHGLVHCQYDDILHKQGIAMPEDIQVEQIDLDTLVLRMVPGALYERERDEPILVEQLREATKDWFAIRVEYVDRIPPTSGFKKSKVVSRLGEAAITESP